MSEKIRTRKYNRGNPKESSWPPDLGTAKKSCMYVFRDGKFQEVEQFRQSAIHAIRTDSMEPIEHPAEPGKLIDSQSRYRAITKKHGLVEVGNEKIKAKEPIMKRMSVEDIMDDVAKARNDCRYGMSGLSEFERERCRRIDERRRNKA